MSFLREICTFSLFSEKFFHMLDLSLRIEVRLSMENILINPILKISKYITKYEIMIKNQMQKKFQNA